MPCAARLKCSAAWPSATRVLPPTSGSTFASASTSATSSSTATISSVMASMSRRALEALADPGGICVSRVVRDQVLDKLSFAFEDLGAQEVKNIARPVEVYRIRDDLADGARRSASKSTRRADDRSAKANVENGVGGLGLRSSLDWLESRHGSRRNSGERHRHRCGGRFRSALRARRTLRSLGQRARGLGPLRGPGHARGDPQPAQDLRVAGGARCLGFHVQGQQGARACPGPVAGGALRARWFGQHLRRPPAAHHRGTGRPDQGSRRLGPRLRRPHRRYPAVRDAVADRRRGVGFAEGGDPRQRTARARRAARPRTSSPTSCTWPGGTS